MIISEAWFIPFLTSDLIWHTMYNVEVSHDLFINEHWAATAACVHKIETIRYDSKIITVTSNHQPHDCFLNRLFRHRLKKRSKFRVTGLCAGNSPEAGEFPAQMASNAEGFHTMTSLCINHSILWELQKKFPCITVCPWALLTQTHDPSPLHPPCPCPCPAISATSTKFARWTTTLS